MASTHPCVHAPPSPTCSQARSKTALRWATHCARARVRVIGSSYVSTGGATAVSRIDTLPSSSAIARNLQSLSTCAAGRGGGQRSVHVPTLHATRAPIHPPTRTPHTHPAVLKSKHWRGGDAWVVDDRAAVGAGLGGQLGDKGAAAQHCTAAGERGMAAAAAAFERACAPSLRSCLPLPALMLPPPSAPVAPSRSRASTAPSSERCSPRLATAMALARGMTAERDWGPGGAAAPAMFKWTSIGGRRVRAGQRHHPGCYPSASGRCLMVRGRARGSGRALARGGMGGARCACRAASARDSRRPGLAPKEQSWGEYAGAGTGSLCS